jgi:hypothetical protein
MLLVMPDRKTAYGTDDGASGLLTKFICTRENDLTEGILYVSKVTQKGNPNISFILILCDCIYYIKCRYHISEGCCYQFDCNYVI